MAGEPTTTAIVIIIPKTIPIITNLLFNARIFTHPDKKQMNWQ
jgi:hypothetical protein